jgi:hypothetical protein
MIYKYSHEALDLYNRMDKTPEKLRNFISEKYDQKYMFEKIDKLMGI